MLISLAVDGRRAPLDVRERFHLSLDAAPILAARICGGPIRELALVSSCHRVELVAWLSPGPDYPGEGAEALASVWAPGASDRRQLLSIVTTRTGLDAARHLLRVAATLESPVVGDQDILGQLRRAYTAAIATGVVGPYLHRLFESALRTGRRVRRETGLGRETRSVGAAAADLARERLPPLAGRRIVVIGAGKTAGQAARALRRHGAVDLTIVNRGRDRAAALAAELDVNSERWDRRYSLIGAADLVVVATAAKEFTVEGEPLIAEWSARRAGPLLIIDLSMPRNVAPSVVSLPGIALVDLGAIRVSASAQDSLLQSIVSAEGIVEAELSSFSEWLAAAPAREAIGALRASVREASREAVTHAAGLAVADEVAERIVARVLAAPMAELRRRSARGEPVDHLLQSLQFLFAEPAIEAAAHSPSGRR